MNMWKLLIVQRYLKMTWIDVNDKQPRDGETCFVVFRKRIMSKSHYSVIKIAVYRKTGFYRNEGKNGRLKTVTYWLPCPELPASVLQENESCCKAIHDSLYD